MNWIASNFTMNETSSKIEKKNNYLIFVHFRRFFFRNFAVDTPFFMAFIFALLCGMTESQQELLHEEMEKSYIYVANWIDLFGCIVPFFICFAKEHMMELYQSYAQNKTTKQKTHTAMFKRNKAKRQKFTSFEEEAAESQNIRTVELKHVYMYFK